MEATSQTEEQLEKLARRGVYCLVMGTGAFFAYFNSIYGWVTPPDYHRTKGVWFSSLMPGLEPYLPQTVIVLGVGLMACAAYCFYRYMALSKSGG